MKYKTNKYIYNFQQSDTIKSFDDSIYTGNINVDEAEKDQNNLLDNIAEFNNRSRRKTKGGKDKK